ncbi:hypothetical protein PVK06_042867 [Gossypium arboreum]|uniref:Reverse transcriptase domain-containing protein n=1 Tax=Gossypium arboreum TaxID=29729 RepID=A0ABR0MMC8_GOSAR|nr:hypothetical protein PVK06_042867 [Gossypium arboreum]
MFADDCILFGEVSIRGICVMKDILKEYKACSRQCVNFEKSTVFFSPNVADQDKDMVFQILNVRSSKNPVKYIGPPNMNSELIFNTFSEQDAERILCIPLSLQEHDDVVIWRGEPTG